MCHTVSMRCDTNWGTKGRGVPHCVQAVCHQLGNQRPGCVTLCPCGVTPTGEPKAGVCHTVSMRCVTNWGTKGRGVSLCPCGVTPTGEPKAGVCHCVHAVCHRKETFLIATLCRRVGHGVPVVGFVLILSWSLPQYRRMLDCYLGCY